MRDLLEQRDRGYIKGVAHRGFKGADAALAEDDVGVAVVEDELRGAEKIGDGGHHSALQQDWPPAAGRCFQQREVLHVAGADLQDVGVLGHQRDIGLAHHFRHNGQAGLCLARAGKHLEALQAVPLECSKESCAA